MKFNKINPFQVTKAVDFTDSEINNFWVDFPSKGGFLTFINPTSPMPMVILGGKGSGKTHLMRYYSYNLQKLRNSKDVVNSIKNEGYLGIYLVCGGLNANRFNGKGIENCVWNSIFTYYMDLSISQILINIILDIFNNEESFNEVEKNICNEIIALFDEFTNYDVTNLNSLNFELDKLRKNIDLEVNNCGITQKISTKIIVSHGKLIFGIPKIIAKNISMFNSIIFLYLIDEMENLNAEQQMYVNTLVREKEIPSSFKIGARLYGARTTLTHSAGEEIKEGSEYEKLVLDSYFRNKDVAQSYKEFSSNLVLKRLNKVSSRVCSFNDKQDCLSELREYFEEIEQDEFYKKQTNELISKFKQNDRPYFRNLTKNLIEYKNNIKGKSILSSEDINDIVNKLSIEEVPILEKLNVFLLYKNWCHDNDLIESAENISKNCKKFISNDNIKSNYKTMFDHWNKDLLAQLYRECDKKLLYYGIETLIEMSHGIPRNLLIILKQIYKWSIFYGEKPFIEGKISIKAQMQGVKDASEWFFQDARPFGDYGWKLRDSISRLAQLFRECRFSDKPTEVSLNSFSVDMSKISDESKKMIELAEKWSLLVSIPGGQKDRNTKRIDNKYQLNRMLSPRWGLPIARRGVISLNEQEINSIFDHDFRSEYEELLKIRVDRMNAPFKKPEQSFKKDDFQLKLFRNIDD